MNKIILKEAFSIRNNLKQLFIRPSDNYAFIDGCRAVAVLYVVVFHCFWLPQYFVDENVFLNYLNAFPKYLIWIWNAHIMVDVFFVISGFLIASQLMREFRNCQTLNIKRFYLRKFLRIAPVYVLALLTFSLLISGNHFDKIWTNLLFVNNFLPAKKMFMPHSWFLAIEGQFYLIVPVFMLFVFFKIRHKLASLIALFFISFLVRFILCRTDSSLLSTPFCHFFFLGLSGGSLDYYESMYINFYTRYGALICGIAAAYLHVYYSEKIVSFFRNRAITANLLVLLSISLNVAILFIPLHDPAIKFPRSFMLIYIVAARNIFCLGIVFMILFALYQIKTGNFIIRFLSCKFWYPVAQLSFSVYLFHYMIVLILYSIITSAGKVQNISVLQIGGITLGVTFLTLFISVVVYLAVEKPILNILKK